MVFAAEDRRRQRWPVSRGAGTFIRITEIWVPNRDGTELLMSVYPQQVRNWIAQRGGLSPRLIYLAGRELTAMYPPCQQRDARN